MNNKKVGLVVPAYNEAERISDTLKGLLSQDYSDLSIIVVDNNSKDETFDIVTQMGVNVVKEYQQGYIYAVNRGVAELEVDYIAICDADTLYPKDWVTKMVAVFEKKPDAVAVYGTASTYDANYLQNKLNKYLYTAFLRLSKLLGLHNTSGFNFMIKKSEYERVGGYDPAYKKMSPDIELGKRLSRVGPIIFDASIEVSSSFRRYQEGGTVQTQMMFLKSWWAMLRGKLPEQSYDSYNVEIK